MIKPGFDFSNKKVLVRVDFNVPLNQKGEVLDNFRIKATLPTIKYLVDQKAKVILISHLGRPKGKDPSLSLKPVAKELEKLGSFKVKFIGDCIGKKVGQKIDRMDPGQVALLENLRFYSGERKNSSSFGRRLAKRGEVYLNDAFSASHRRHASIVGIPKYLPHGKGLLFKKEIKALSRVTENPRRPLIIIMGGIKTKTRLRLIPRFLEMSDYLILGAKIAEKVLSSKGILVGKKLPPFKLQEMIGGLDLTNPQFRLPTDVKIGLKDKKEEYFREGGIGTLRAEEEIFDIGPETIKIFSKIIKLGKTIVWSGPLGMFEEERFALGTRKIANVVVRNRPSFKVAGGGDTVSAIRKFDLEDKFDHLSSGGGAMLRFLSGKELPGLQALG